MSPLQPPTNFLQVIPLSHSVPAGEIHHAAVTTKCHCGDLFTVLIYIYIEFWIEQMLHFCLI